jgi:hypothetical protein
MASDYQYTDDTMPLAAEVEREFQDKAIDEAGAIECLTDWRIDPGPVLAAVGRVARIQCSFPWDGETERHRFIIYDSQHVGPKGNWYVAIPVLQGGVFTDLLLLDQEDLSVTRVCGIAEWLGRDEFGATQEVRLHRDPADWLEAGCTGVCHIEPISRAGLKDLQQMDRIICSDVHTALEAWDWGFGGNDAELGRFVIDAEPEMIRTYFERQAKWTALTVIRQDADHA